MSKQLPSFFVIGAQKAGTTALHDWLRQQPEVRLPSIKETNFFSQEDIYRRGIDWYLSQFPFLGEGCIAGEIDPEYMFRDGCAERIKELVCSPRFIFLLRNPIDRAYSHYLMSLRRGCENLGFIDALEAEGKRLSSADNGFPLLHHSYITRGMYAKQIRRFMEVLPSSEYLFVKFDDMVSKETGLDTYKRICAFIGVRSSPELADRTKKSNEASTFRSRFVRDLLYRSRRTFVRKAIGSLLDDSTKLKIALMLDRLNQAPLKNKNRADISSVPYFIKEAVVKDLFETERQTGLDLTNWRTSLAET